jgi:hypothetical protein
VATDLLGDRAWRAAPLTDSDAHALVHTPRASALLDGSDDGALVELLLRLGQLADELPEVKRLTLTVLAHSGAVAVTDAQISYGDASVRPDTGPRRL